MFPTPRVAFDQLPDGRIFGVEQAGPQTPFLRPLTGPQHPHADFAQLQPRGDDVRPGGFMGVGAYVTALAWNNLGLSPWLGIPLGLICAAALALVVAWPCFRFRITGHYFALVTLALSGIVLQVITATRDLTGGSLGYTPNRVPGGSVLAFQFTDKLSWYFVALTVWAVGLVIWHLVLY